MIIQLHLPIEPKALPRARHTARKGYVSSYYSRDTNAIFDIYAETLKLAVSKLDEQTRYNIRGMVEKPPERLGIVLYVIFYMPMPKSWSKKRKIELDMKPHLIKSDLDNLLKMILDRAEGLLFDNDKRIYSIRAEKVYSDRPRIELTLNYEIV
jgi:Holliday junction resolvase RusA-like endonuclease